MSNLPSAQNLEEYQPGNKDTYLDVISNRDRCIEVSVFIIFWLSLTESEACLHHRTHMGQILQDGENVRLTSSFFKK